MLIYYYVLAIDVSKIVGVVSNFAVSRILPQIGLAYSHILT